MEQKIQQLLSRLAEVEEVLGQPHLYEDQKKFRAYSQEHAYLTQLKNVWEEKKRLEQQIADNQELLKIEKDFEFAEVLREDLSQLVKKVEDLQTQIENLLVPPDPNDHRPTIIELRAGTGGDEAALFVGDCVRMYKLFADKMGWRYELLSCTPSEIGGFKEYVMVITGQNVYRFLHYEAGTHRVQRIPQTEAQGRVHTSAITVAVLHEPDESEEINIDEKELRVDTYRSSGAGGQHVNVTDSAVRLTHIPTGIVVSCQDERSQHKNKDKAMRILKAKLAEAEEQKQQQAMATTRMSQVGSGDRSERIRTYNFPQNRLTEHRINLTKYNLDQIMNGELYDVVSPLVAYFHQEKLKAADPT
jgi:peptide chain release factor 1